MNTKDKDTKKTNESAKKSTSTADKKPAVKKTDDKKGK